ncbi:hypothetical protein MIR68_003504 [Amoeboaphelidium protococcarum]|nr:hypothetical protein MIR68_003504 [Amoeboaphelidium protococcarum]
MATFNTLIDQKLQKVRVGSTHVPFYFDNESDVSATETDYSDYEEDFHGDLEALLQELQALFDEKISTGKLIVQDTDAFTDDGKQVMLIKQPFASKLKHHLFHPAIYRNIKPLSLFGGTGVECLARLLGVQDIWRYTYDIAVADRYVGLALAGLISMADANESSVAHQLHNIILHVSYSLNIGVKAADQQMAIVGGFMCHPEFDYFGLTDLRVLQSGPSGRVLLSTELKTCAAFPNGHPWYVQSRLAQTLSQLYSTNAPVLLLTPQRFKVFAENEARDSIYTYPYQSSSDNANLASSESLAVDEELLKVIVICLCQALKPILPSESGVQQVISQSVEQSPAKFSAKPIDSISKDRKRSHAVAFSSSGRQPIVPKQPKFKIGQNEDGSAIYADVRVMAECDMVRYLPEELSTSSDDSFTDDEKPVESATAHTSAVTEECTTKPLQNDC